MPAVKLLILGISFCFSTCVIAQVTLNEIVSSNEKSLVINGESPDWIELYNASNFSVQLENYSLSDNKSSLQKYIFPSISIGPKEYLIILCDGLSIQNEYIHTNFKISASGETLFFSDEEKKLIQTIEIPSLQEDTSYSLIDNAWEITLPTPGQPNIKTAFTSLQNIEFSKKSGFYNPTSITLSNINHSGQIEYFVNGLETSLTTDKTTIDLPINHTSTICAKSKSGLFSSDLICHTFIVNQQHSIPILSLSINGPALFDSIYGLFSDGPNADPNWPHYGANYWNEDEIETYFQYFNFAKDSVFQGHADLEMHGGRESRVQPQKTFRLKAKNKYNQEFFHHNFFSVKPNISSFKRLVVRNGSGDFDGMHVKDGFLQNYLVSSGINLDANSYEAIAVYINGSYYGLMGLREKMDEYYTLSNYGIKEVDLLEKELEIVNGDTIDFLSDYNLINTNDLSIDKNLGLVSSKFDLTNIIDYFLAQICNNSTAWPQNNIKYWKAKNQNSKWRYLLYDMDNSLGSKAWTEAHINSLENKLNGFGLSNIFINIINALLQNTSFKNALINRHQDLYNTALKSDVMNYELDYFVKQVESEMALHLTKWPQITFSDWKNIEVEKVKTFIDDRPYFSMKYFQEYFHLDDLFTLKFSSNISQNTDIELNSLKALPWEFEGVYFKQIPIHFNIKTPPGFFFDHIEIISKNDTTVIITNELTAGFFADTEIRAVYQHPDNDEDKINVIHAHNQSIKLLINSSDGLSKNYKIIDIAGRELKNGKFDNLQIGSNFMELQLNNYIEGILVILVYNDQQTFNQKFYMSY